MNFQQYTILNFFLSLIQITQHPGSLWCWVCFLIELNFHVVVVVFFFFMSFLVLKQFRLLLAYFLLVIFSLFPSAIEIGHKKELLCVE